MTLLAHFLFLTVDKTCFVPTLIDCRFFWGDFRHLRSPVTFQHVLFLNEGERQRLGLRDRGGHLDCGGGCFRCLSELRVD